MNILIKETESFRLEHDLETNSIHQTVHRFLITDDWKDCLGSGLDYLKDHNLTSWLSDNRHLPEVHTNIDRWLYTFWLPAMIESGWQKWAFVEPKINQGKIATEKYKESFSQFGLEAKGFANLDEAKSWLKIST